LDTALLRLIFLPPPETSLAHRPGSCPPNFSCSPAPPHPRLRRRVPPSSFRVPEIFQCERGSLASVCALFCSVCSSLTSLCFLAFEESRGPPAPPPPIPRPARKFPPFLPRRTALAGPPELPFFFFSFIWRAWPWRFHVSLLALFSFCHAPLFPSRSFCSSTL